MKKKKIKASLEYPQSKFPNCHRKRGVLKASFEVLRDFLIVFPAIVFFVAGFGVLNTAGAAYIPVPQSLCGIFPCPTGATGEAMARSLVGKIVDNVRLIIGAVAIVIIIVTGVKLVFSGGNEEAFSKASTTLLYAIIGLFFVGLAGDLSRIFDTDRGGFLRDPSVAVQRSRLFSRTLEIVITFIKYVIGSVAVLFIVRSGLRLVLVGGNEEDVTKDKKSILYGLLGLVLILISNPIINNVFFKVNTGMYPGLEPVRPGIDVQRLLQEVAGITNLVAAITGPVALLSLLAGGLMYALAAGEEEKIGKAKKIITWSLIGILIIYGAFAIVGTFVTRQFTGL